MKSHLTQAVLTLLVALSCFTAGFFASAATPLPTYVLTNSFGNTDQSSYTKEQLVDYAVQTHALTVYGTNTEVPLDTEAKQHLQDVHNVIKPLLVPLVLLYVATFVWIVLLSKQGKQNITYPALVTGGVLVLLVFVLLGLWGCIDFYGLFAWMHSLFFVEGTWTFPADSLLIRMYPLPFWIGMGILWLGVSVVLAVLCVLLGLRERKRCINTGNYISA